MNHKGLLLWTEVVCISCSTTMSGEFVRHGRRQMRMIKAEMALAKWIIKDGNAVCPNCQRANAVAPIEQLPRVELPTPIEGAK